jgi:hypothetical protein
LHKQEYVNLRHWFAEKDWGIWDKQIKENSNSGKLDFLAKEAIKPVPRHTEIDEILARHIRKHLGLK